MSEYIYEHKPSGADHMGKPVEFPTLVQREECKMVTSGTPCEGNTDKACTRCGAYNIGEFYDGNCHRSTPNYCPNCGAKVVNYD